MQCHKPGHRAPARCVSALLAAGALLATVADQLGGTPDRPAMRAAALEVPTTPDPAAPQPPAWLQASGGPARPSVATPDPPDPVTRKARLAKPTRHATTWLRHQSASKHHWIHRSHWAQVHHTGTSLLAHLPEPRNRNAAEAVREALSLLGVPYRWGGTTRAGFDCSGFTQHVWAVAGVKIPRTVRAQARAGTSIPLNKAEPGDLVVFYPTQHHIGIYVGNGVVIDSPHTGSTVRPDPVHSMPVSLVVRVRA